MKIPTEDPIGRGKSAYREKKPMLRLSRRLVRKTSGSISAPARKVSITLPLPARKSIQGVLLRWKVLPAKNPRRISTNATEMPNCTEPSAAASARPIQRAAINRIFISPSGARANKNPSRNPSFGRGHQSSRMVKGEPHHPPGTPTKNSCAVSRQESSVPRCGTVQANSIAFDLVQTVYRCDPGPASNDDCLCAQESANTSVMEAEAHFPEELPGAVEVRPAEGVAAVEQEVSVAQVECGEAEEPPFAERLSERHTDGCMRRQVPGPIAVQKSRPVIHVGRNPALPGQRHAKARRQGVTLVVVQEEEALVGRAEAGESAADTAPAFGELVGVGQVELGATPEPRRAHGGFPAVNPRRCDGKRKEDVGVADHIMVEEVVRARVEAVHVEYPAAQGNRQADFVLRVALAVERQEPEPLLEGQIEQRSGDCRERRRLIVAAVIAAEDPVEFRHANRRAHSRVCRILGERAGKVRQPYAAIECQPARQLELVFQEQSFQVPVELLLLLERGPAAVRRPEPEEAVVMLGEGVEPEARVVPAAHHGERHLPAGIVRAAMVGGDDGRVVRPAVERGAVEMIERGNRKEQTRSGSVHPRKVDKGVSLPLDVADAGGLVARRVRNLEIIRPDGGYQTQLIGGRGVEDQRSERAEAVAPIVQHVGRRSLQAEIRAVAVETGVVGEAVGVVAETDLVIRFVEAAEAGHNFGLAVALEAGAGDDIEDSESPVAVFGRIAAASDLNGLDVLGIKLRPDIAGDVRVRYGDAVH